MTPLEEQTLARTYHDAVHAAVRAEVPGAPEAQLTAPVAALMTGLAELFGVGRLECIPESRRDAIRPDLALLLDGRLVGYVELKRPSLSADFEERSGWTANQREHLASLDSLVLCNGREARLYARGRQVGPMAPLPYVDPEGWNPRPLVELLRSLAVMRPSSVTRVPDLARRLALRTASLRDRNLDLLEAIPPMPAEAVKQAQDARDSWRALLQPNATHRDYADGLAQVLAYGLAIAALDGEADGDDGRVCAAKAMGWLKGFLPVLAASSETLLEQPAFLDAVRSEVATI